MNLDLYTGKTWHRSDYDYRTQKPIYLRFIPNFVKGEALHLPFRDRAFETVCSAHLIEHFDDPLQFLSECKRVTHKAVIVKCPHKLGPLAKKPEHKHSFNIKWFAKAFKVLGMEIVDSKTDFNMFRPTEIMIEAWRLGT